MWAMVVRVDIAPSGGNDAAREALENEVVPMTKDMPGFQSGVWMRHEGGASGLATILFEEEQQARDAVGMVIPGSEAPGGATIRDVDVYEVMVRA